MQRARWIHATQCLAVVVTIAEAAPSFLAEPMPGILERLVSIVSAQGMDAAVHNQAIECLLSVVEGDPDSLVECEFLGAFLQATLPLLVKPLLKVDRTEQWVEEDDDDLEPSDVDVALEALDRVACALGPDPLVSVALPLMSQLCGDAADWRARFAAVQMLAEIAEGVAEFLEDNAAVVQQLLQGLVMPGLQHPHPRVRHAAAKCIARLATHLPPQFQAATGDVLVPGLQPLLTDPVAKVATEACLATARFFAGAPSDCAARHAHSTGAAALGVLAGAGPAALHANAWTALCAVAQTAQEACAPFYEATMRQATQALSTAQPRDRGWQTVRARAMLCAAHMGAAVGKARFLSDGAALMTLLQGLRPQLQDGDPQLPSLSRAQARIAEVLGADFAPFAASVIPPLLDSIADVARGVATGAAPGLDGAQVAVFAVKGQDTQHVHIHTEFLNEKSEACLTLSAYLTGVGPVLRPFLPRAAEITVPLIHFRYHAALRRSALEVMCRLPRALALQC